MREELKRDAVKGVGWSFVSSTCVRILQIITTLTLAKLLMPADFGIFALANLILGGIIISRDVGFAQVLIYLQGDIRKSSNTAFWLSVLSSGIIAVSLAASAPFLAMIFNAPEIIRPLQVMSVALIISGISNVPLALIDKRLQFRKRAFIEIISVAFYTAISITLALSGFGVWSLIIGWFAMVTISSIAVLAIGQWKPKLEFDYKEIGPIFGYGKHLMIASLAAFAFFQVDKGTVGKWLGVTELGFYSMAFIVCNMPATNLAHVINRVMFPTYSRLQDDITAMRRVYLQTMKYISLVSFPATIAILVLADPAITVFYGEKWMPAIPLFYVLAIYGLARSIGSTVGAVFMSTGNPQCLKQMSYLQLLVAVPFVYPVTIAFGAMGVAVLFTIAYCIGMVYALGKVGRILSIESTKYLQAVKFPLGAALLAGAFGLSANLLHEATLPTIAAMGMMIGSVYGLSILLVDKNSFGEIFKILLQNKGKRIDADTSKENFPVK